MLFIVTLACAAGGIMISEVIVSGLKSTENVSFFTFCFLIGLYGLYSDVEKMA